MKETEFFELSDVGQGHAKTSGTFLEGENQLLPRHLVVLACGRGGYGEEHTGRGQRAGSAPAPSPCARRAEALGFGKGSAALLGVNLIQPCWQRSILLLLLQNAHAVSLPPRCPGRGIEGQERPQKGTCPFPTCGAVATRATRTLK